MVSSGRSFSEPDAAPDHLGSGFILAGLVDPGIRLGMALERSAPDAIELSMLGKPSGVAQGPNA